MNESAAGYLTGHLLVAMPQMEDPRFARTVIFLCAHTSEGAMGLVVNKLMDSVAFPDLLDQQLSGWIREPPYGPQLQIGGLQPPEI